MEALFRACTTLSEEATASGEATKGTEGIMVAFLEVVGSTIAGEGVLDLDLDLDRDWSMSGQEAPATTELGPLNSSRSPSLRSLPPLLLGYSSEWMPPVISKVSYWSASPGGR